MKVFREIDTSALPSGLTKKELIKRPEMKDIRSWFTLAGIAQIATGLLNIATVGQYAELLAQGYQVDEGFLMFLGFLSFIFIGLGIALLVSKSTVLAFVVGILGILMAIAAIATGGSVGAGIIAAILAIIGAARAEKTWRLYSERIGEK